MMRIRENLGPLRRRSLAAMAMIFVALGVLHLRLAQLQLVEGDEWRRMAENNRLRRMPVSAPRGRIFDRRGVVLADIVPTWNLLLFPDEARDLDRTVGFLARLGAADRATLRQQIDARRIGRLAPLLVGEALSWEQVATVRAHQADHPELSVVPGFRRFYPFVHTAHIVGHLRMVTAEEVQGDPTLDPSSLIGATGIEALYDPVLAGAGGERWTVVSAAGRQIGSVREEPAVAGTDLTLTLDLELQEAAARALGERSGAVVALDPRTGGVRVLYSAPCFDPNLFVSRLSPETWEALIDDPGHPLQNRAVQGVYPPGSTIKPFLALAGLGHGVVNPGSSVYCRGSITLFGHQFRCWRRGGHGHVRLQRSLEVSCDVYYYLLGQRLGIERIAEWLERFGFGRSTGLGFPTEASGLIGTPEWSERVRGSPWYAGEVVSVSIGQGPLLVTPLQLARGFAALANTGRLVTPHLVTGTGVPPQDVGLDPHHLDEVVTGLRNVITGSEGTARSLDPQPIVGKTGTAQVARLQEGVPEEDLPEHLRHHAWFVGWAPVDDPRLVVAVVVEHGGGGGSVAAPIAGEIFAAGLAMPR